MFGRRIKLNVCIEKLINFEHQNLATVSLSMKPYGATVVLYYF